MSLEVLLGPQQMVVPILGNTSASKTPFWLDHLGLCGYYLETGTVLQVQTNPYCIFQVDGKGYVRNVPPLLSDAGNFYYDFQTEGLLHTSGGVTGLFDAFTGNKITTAGLTEGTRYFDRYLRGQNGNIQTAPLIAPFTWVTEYTLVEPPGRPALFSAAVISDYGGGLLAFTYPNNGDIYIYDPVAKVQVGEWKTINLENSGIWYSKALNVWISRHVVIGPPDEKLRVWANETRPATISTPTALQAVTRGKVSDIRVQLLGASTDPAVGQRVDFSILSGPGQLINLQALTDVSGYAISRYRCPASGVGSVNIQAQTVF